jgi:hypothetical protein
MFGMRGGTGENLYKLIRSLNTRQPMKECFLGQKKRSQFWTEPKKTPTDAGVFM